MTADSAAETAWAALLEDLRAAGATVTGPLGARNERERAEGFRHVLRVLSIAEEMLLEKGDPARPAFTRWMTPHRKMLGDNPHTIYDAAIIEPGRTYRLHGRLGTSTYVGICVYGTDPEGRRRIVGNLDDVDLTVEGDGSFEVWLVGASAEAPDDAVRMPLDEDTTDVMIRQYFLDPDREDPAIYTIEAVPEAGPPPPLDEATLAGRLQAVGSYVREILQVETTLSALMATATPAVLRGGEEYVDADGQSTAPPIDPSIVAKAMPSPAIQYSGMWFDDLGPDEAVVVEGAVPECRYWSIQLLTRWMESGDWQRHRVFLTGEDIQASAGRFKAVVAHRDPGLPNWLQTSGLTSANIAVRSLLGTDQLDVDFRRVTLPLEV